MSFLNARGTWIVPQWAPFASLGQVPGPAGGFIWRADDWSRLRRFLILGSEGGTYHATEWNLTRENAQAVERCIAADGERAVGEIVHASEQGRSASNDPALFALAMAAGVGDERTRRLALEMLPRVARTGTHLFRFVAFVEQFRGWGRSLRRAVGRWYAGSPVDVLAHQAVTDRRREGATHRDLVRLAHPAGRASAGNPAVEVSSSHATLFEWIVRGTDADGLPRVLEGFARAQAADTPMRAAALVHEYGLPREALKPQHLTSAEVWTALLENMPISALVRSLATMTGVGLIAPGSAGTAKVVSALSDGARIRSARVHPIELLAALGAYAAGGGVRGQGRWVPVRDVIEALDAAFYAAFENVRATGKRLLLALDVSSSMGAGDVRGAPGLTQRDASAALALVTTATEERCEIVGFFAGESGFSKRGPGRIPGRIDGLTPLSISPHQRLDDAIGTVSGLPFGGTDCALPMLYARALDRAVDTFVIYTDSETWAGRIDPVQALRQYREASGIDARLVVVGMVSNGFSIADPGDPGMLDVVGFDSATPQLIADFARGAL